MPSASAKLEKQASTEVSDPIGKVLTMVEKKVRNLEKRKGRLDNYRAEHQAGKELNEDQMNAIKKYDVVVESLEFLRDFQKSVSNVMQEHIKQQKKQAKKEQLERQQQEMQRVRDILLIQDILNNMGTEEVRAHFLTGTHGAVRLTEEELNHLDELFKLVVAERNKEDESLPPFDDQLITASDHLVGILDGKNKEILGTTYKALRELIMKIHECGYFDKTPAENTETPNDVEENATNFDDYPEKEEEEYDVPQGVTEIVPSGQGQQQVAIPSEVAHSQDESVGLRQTAPAAPVDGYSVSSGHVPAAAAAATTYGGQNRPLTDLLSMQGGFNFLQESQVEPESPHMDPAVVAAHPMAPPAMGYHTPGYPPVTQQAPPMGLAGPPQAPVIAAAAEETLAGSTMAPSGVRQQQMGVSNASQQPQPQQTAGSSPAGVAQDYDDPAQPIPTQTFTNQSFAAMQTMMQVPPAANFVQATIGHGVLPAAAAAAQMAVVAAAAASAPQAAPPAPTDAQLTNQTHTSASTAEFQPSLSNGGSASQSGDEQQISNNRYQESEENEAAPGSYPHSNQGNNYNQSQNTFVNNRGGRGGGGRGRGATNGFSRGGQRGGYGSGNRGGYRGNFNASDSYNNNYRRGGASSRGAPRGGGQPGRGGSNPRGRGNFRGQ